MRMGKAKKDRAKAKKSKKTQHGVDAKGGGEANGEREMGTETVQREPPPGLAEMPSESQAPGAAFAIDQVVWIELKGGTSWPARISKSGQSSRRSTRAAHRGLHAANGKYHITFFGDGAFTVAWCDTVENGAYTGAWCDPQDIMQNFEGEMEAQLQVTVPETLQAERAVSIEAARAFFKSHPAAQVGKGEIEMKPPPIHQTRDPYDRVVPRPPKQQPPPRMQLPPDHQKVLASHEHYDEDNGNGDDHWLHPKWHPRPSWQEPNEGTIAWQIRIREHQLRWIHRRAATTYRNKLRSAQLRLMLSFFQAPRLAKDCPVAAKFDVDVSELVATHMLVTGPL